MRRPSVVLALAILLAVTACDFLIGAPVAPRECVRGDPVHGWAVDSATGDSTRYMTFYPCVAVRRR